ncbi:aminotransferase class V-fold PLP-dependent enzyme [Pseudosulfitobacter koreensis]|uniref:Aminotransferase class V-fold PLP-dependent enzyme n=1 Tax=Pseudosulfitobacter koreensis TaxID=2968472 RepID=A0ABT1Z418_9RHOB|nr:aminotransferase class V-fold PLP-dependent enzyme [Pseudosulfitobacter koreense]MCR8827869.1 aminotransferase class V-fold PLP-dependent enzyme [Pseudosulfitobacter koreense]
MNVEMLRADTPSCRSYVHANNAGASPVPEPVHQAVLRHLDLERRIGGYAAQEAAAQDLTAFYTEAAALIGALPEEIAFIENATRAWDMAFYGMRLQPGDRIVTHASEYVSNVLAMLQRAEAAGVQIDFAPSDPSGQVDVAAMERMITPRTKLIALTHVPTSGGLVNPAEDAGRLARQHGIHFLLDACQSVGQIDIDVESIGCDMLCATGRKFLRGPRGTGFLFVRKTMIDRLEPPFVDLWAADWTAADAYELQPSARRFETFERHVAGQIGLLEAIRYARAIGLPQIEARITALAEDLRQRLAEVPGIRLHDTGARRCGIVTFTRKGEVAEQTALRLRHAGVMVSFTPRAYARIDFEARGLDAVVRASLHCFNDLNDLERLVATVAGETGARSVPDV